MELKEFARLLARYRQPIAVLAGVALLSASVVYVGAEVFQIQFFADIIVDVSAASEETHDFTRWMLTLGGRVPYSRDTLGVYVLLSVLAGLAWYYRGTEDRPME